MTHRTRVLSLALIATSISSACATPPADSLPSGSKAQHDAVSYRDTTGRRDLYTGGVRLIPISTPKGTFNVWTKRTGNNPTIKVLLLHGGPGMTHEYWEAADSYFPGASVEYYYYDQLGSYYSDQPKDTSLWNVDRFVDEVEQVRTALGLDSTNFFLMGHSWGGMLAIEYALKYQSHLKGLIISNMMASIPAYNVYANNVLMPAMDQKVLAEIKKLEAKKQYANPRYMELLIPNHYQIHLLRKPVAEWPDGMNRAFKHVNNDIYIPMQGPSELGASGKLVEWDRVADLPKITVPTLVIAGKYDTMDPAHMEMMSKAVKHGRLLMCPNSGHMAMYDDQLLYFGGVIKFLNDVDQKTF